MLLVAVTRYGVSVYRQRAIGGFAWLASFPNWPDALMSIPSLSHDGEQWRVRG